VNPSIAISELGLGSATFSGLRLSAGRPYLLPMTASLYPYETCSIALTEPPPRRAPTTVRPPGGIFRLEDRLPGVLGSIAPPPSYAIRAMQPTISAPSQSSRGLWLGVALLAISGLTAAVVFRDITRAPVTLSPSPP